MHHYKSTSSHERQYREPITSTFEHPFKCSQKQAQMQETENSISHQKTIERDFSKSKLSTFERTSSQSKLENCEMLLKSSRHEYSMQPPPVESKFSRFWSVKRVPVKTTTGGVVCESREDEASTKRVGSMRAELDSKETRANYTSDLKTSFKLSTQMLETQLQILQNQAQIQLNLGDNNNENINNNLNHNLIDTNLNANNNNHIKPTSNSNSTLNRHQHQSTTKPHSLNDAESIPLIQQTSSSSSSSYPPSSSGSSSGSTSDAHSLDLHPPQPPSPLPEMDETDFAIPTCAKLRCTSLSNPILSSILNANNSSQPLLSASLNLGNDATLNDDDISTDPSMTMPPFTNHAQKILHLSPASANGVCRSNEFGWAGSAGGQLGSQNCMAGKATRILIGIIMLLALILIGLIISDQIFLHKLSRSVAQSQQQRDQHLNLNSNQQLQVAASSADPTRYSSRDFPRDDDDDSDTDEHRDRDRDRDHHQPERDFFPHQANRRPSSRQGGQLAGRNDHEPAHFGRERDRNRDNEHDITENHMIPQPPFRSSGQADSHGRLNKWRDPDAVCMSPGCVRAAAQILNNIDNTTSPCDNFYRFSCGRWIDTQVIPDEKSRVSVLLQINSELNVQLRALVEAKPQASDPLIVGQMRNLYSSCMNLSEIESRGEEPLLEVLRDLGGWPVLTTTTLSNANSSSSVSQLQRRSTPTPSLSPAAPPAATTTTARPGAQRRNSPVLRRLKRQAGQPTSPSVATSNNNTQQQWLNTLIRITKRGFSQDMIIDLSVVVDIRNNTRYIVELDQSSLGMPDRSYYFKGMNDTTVAAYYKLMCDAAVMLGAPPAEARAQMLEAFEFETNLAKISIVREQRLNVSRLYNKMAAQDLYSLAPNINWQKYLTSLLDEPDFNMSEDYVVVKVPNFLRKLDALLLKTEPRVITNYMIWRIVHNSMSSLSRRWRELAFSYNSVITGRQVEEARWEVCLSSLGGTLGRALSAMYVKKHFNQLSKEAAMEMVEYIRSEFLRILDEVDWMDEETRREAKLKAQAISPYIGYPDELLDEHLIEELYDGLSLGRSNYYANLRSLRIWSTNYAFGQLRKQNKRGDWKKHAHAALVNAFYSRFDNSIEVPAGILRGAFFDTERPNYMNFGAIGYVIGHEITHAFDDRGRQYDKDGQDRFWWKPKTDARFRERAQCIIEQYGNYTVKEIGLSVNGLNTQGENIADNGGIKKSYRAYQRWTKDHGREARLPGLSYSPDQLFWISAANIWCTKHRPEILKLWVNSGTHSPAEFRVIGPFSNSPDFAKSFNCPLGSPMNPHKKCTVW